MNGRTLLSIGIALNAGMLLVAPVTIRAQVDPTQQFTADEVRSDYVQRGFAVEAPNVWSTPDHLTTIRVSDPASDRVLMAVVYPDLTSAQAAQARVESLENDETGRLVRGYGPSLWRGNVGLVESTWTDLGLLYDSDQADAAGVMRTAGGGFEAALAWRGTHTVEDDFLSALDGGTVTI